MEVKKYHAENGVFGNQVFTRNQFRAMGYRTKAMRFGLRVFSSSRDANGKLPIDTSCKEVMVTFGEKFI